MAGRCHDVVIIGAGQAGLSLSYCLTAAGIEHVILERGRVGNAWRVDRWDSFCLVTPNWSITLPGAVYDGGDPHGFLSGPALLQRLEAWAGRFGAPVREGVRATGLSAAGRGFVVDTDSGPILGRRVVVATATHQTPKIPAVAAGLPSGVAQAPAARYRNPARLEPGAVLVVGSGQSGCQIAEELNAAGRDVLLSVSRVGRLPRRYRGRDCIAWQRDMGLLDREPAALPDPTHRFLPDPHVSGVAGGRTLSLHALRADGVELLGRVSDVAGRRIRLAPDLAANMAFADAFAADFRRRVDAHIAASGRDAPTAGPADRIGEPTMSAPPPAGPETLNLADRNVRTVIWATGFSYDFSWISFPVRDPAGYPVTRRGVAAVPGLYFIGLNWMSKRKSGILYGVAEDARRLAGRIVADWRLTSAP